MDSAAIVGIIVCVLLGVYSIKVTSGHKKQELYEETESPKSLSVPIASINALNAPLNNETVLNNNSSGINLSDYDYDIKIDINVAVPESVKAEPESKSKPHRRPGKSLIVTANRNYNSSSSTGKLCDSDVAEGSPNLFKKSGYKWKKQKKRSRGEKYSYNVCNYTDEDLFYKQCKNIEEIFPDLIKEPIFKDADQSSFQTYHHEKGDIVVCNHEAVGALYITSDFDLNEYL